jgi:shikimate dehydrogenase
VTDRAIELAVGRGQAGYAVVGFPLERTLSPPMHNAAFRHHGLAAVYLPVPIAPDRFPEGIRSLAEAGFRGLSVTVPFKRAAYELVTERTAVAERAGSVNTILIDGDRRIGTSTDGEGFVRDLAHAGVKTPGRVLCLGSGGAARAVVCALLDAGAREVTVAARRLDRAAWASAEGVRLQALESVAEPGADFDCDLLVQTTPLGSDGVSSVPLEWGRVRPSTRVVDLVYAPPRTPFLLEAEARGCSVRNGLGMLLFQGALAFSFWTGLEAPIEEMAHAIGFLDGAGTGLGGRAARARRSESL